MISSVLGQGLETLKEEIFTKLALKRIFLKPRGQEPDLNQPLIVSSWATVADVAREIGQAIGIGKNAYVWGQSAKFPGQLVANDHLLTDEDIVSFR